MNIRPILFNTDMVRALLDGRKTQTRRPVNSGVTELIEFMSGHCEEERTGESFARFVYRAWKDEEGKSYPPEFQVYCSEYPEEGFSPIGQSPFGRKGDLLYVRETFADCGPRLTYRADNDGAHCVVKKWTPSIHMPRWDSRITLEITDIRVERVQEISMSAIKAEGIKQRFPNVNDQFTPKIMQGEFIELWNSIYSSWNDNPWVWVIEFRVIHANVDEFLKTKA